MQSLIIGGSGKIGKSLNYKHSKKTFYKNKIKNGIRFNLINDDINLLIEKYKINRVIFEESSNSSNVENNHFYLDNNGSLLQ